MSDAVQDTPANDGKSQDQPDLSDSISRLDISTAKTTSTSTLDPVKERKFLNRILTSLDDFEESSKEWINHRDKCSDDSKVSVGNDSAKSDGQITCPECEKLQDIEDEREMGDRSERDGVRLMVDVVQYLNYTRSCGSENVSEKMASILGKPADMTLKGSMFDTMTAIKEEVLKRLRELENSDGKSATTPSG